MSIFFFIVLEIFSIFFTSLSDSVFISKIFLFIAYLISSSVLPTPEKTIFLGFIPAFIALMSSPIETTSAPKPNFFISFSKYKLGLDFTAKHIKGSKLLKLFLKFRILFFSFEYE